MAAMRALRRAIGALACTAGVAAAAEPETRPLGDALEVGENRCMTKAELAANVQVWLGRPGVDRRIQIAVEQIDEDSLRFVVSRDGKPSAERRFRTSDVTCPDLRAAVALAIALAIDATVMQAILEPVPAEPPLPPPKPEPPPPVPLRPKPAPPPPPAPPTAELEVEARALGLLGVLPEPVLGASFGAAAPLARDLRLRLSGWGTMPREVPVGSARARVAMVAGQASLCLAEGSLRACAGAAAGRWSAEGRGFERDRVTNLPWAALVADLGASLPLGEVVSLAGAVHGFLPVLRPVLEERDPRGSAVATRSPPPAGLGASAGVVVGFR